MAAKTHIITCQYTGIEFEAASSRAKNHPAIAALLTEANKTGRYGVVVTALEKARVPCASPSRRRRLLLDQR